MHVWLDINNHSLNANKNIFQNCQHYSVAEFNFRGLTAEERFD